MKRIISYSCPNCNKKMSLYKPAINLTGICKSCGTNIKVSYDYFINTWYAFFWLILLIPLTAYGTIYNNSVFPDSNPNSPLLDKILFNFFWFGLIINVVISKIIGTIVGSIIYKQKSE